MAISHWCTATKRSPSKKTSSGLDFKICGWNYSAQLLFNDDGMTVKSTVILKRKLGFQTLVVHTYSLDIIT